MDTFSSSFKCFENLVILVDYFCSFGIKRIGFNLITALTFTFILKIAKLSQSPSFVWLSKLYNHGGTANRQIATATATTTARSLEANF